MTPSQQQPTEGEKELSDAIKDFLSRQKLPTEKEMEILDKTYSRLRSDKPTNLMDFPSTAPTTISPTEEEMEREAEAWAKGNYFKIGTKSAKLQEFQQTFGRIT